MVYRSNKIMNTSSIKKRFVFTVGANIIRAFTSFASGTLLGRYLGPETYGTMSFLLGTFMGIRYLIDMGSSQAFFTFLSQRPPTRKFINLFIVWLFIQFLLPVIFIGLLFPSAWISSIWHNNSRVLVILAFAATFMQNTVWPVFQNAGESQRQTKMVQGVGVAISVLHLLAIIIFWYLGRLGIYVIFSVVALEYLFGSIIVQKWFIYSKHKINELDENYKTIIKKYYVFCLPLVPYAFCSFGFEFVDKWLLQSYGGSIEQAYYAIGMQLSYISLIATTSIIRILWKEVAEAYYSDNYELTGILYSKVSRVLFLVACICSGFLIPWSKVILNIIFGNAYLEGDLTLSILFLYPIHQSMGQIGSTMLFATEKTRIQVIISLIFMICSMIASYFLLASKKSLIPGFELGSLGLAVKMVVMQFFQVNAVAYIISRIFKWKFDWSYQFYSIGGCLIIGWVTQQVIVHISINLISNNLAKITMGGILYFLTIIGFVYIFPQLAGIKRSDIDKIFSKIKMNFVDNN
jgi:O-antigen/teichoic acid export membrane protein